MLHDNIGLTTLPARVTLRWTFRQAILHRATFCGVTGGVGKEKKPSTVKNSSTKFSQRVKNATSTATSSLVVLLT
jgi:hypothetical protein